VSPAECAGPAVRWLRRRRSRSHEARISRMRLPRRVRWCATQSSTPSNGTANGYGRGEPRTAAGLMTTTTAKRMRVMSGMRPSGRLHLGHLVGALISWAELSKTADVFFEIADLHAYTTHFQNPDEIRSAREEMVRDWL